MGNVDEKFHRNELASQVALKVSNRLASQALGALTVSMIAMVALGIAIVLQAPMWLSAALFIVFCVAWWKLHSYQLTMLALSTQMHTRGLESSRIQQG